MGFPEFHPAALFGAVLAFAGHHGGVEELRGQPGQFAVGAERAAIGGEHLSKVVRPPAAPPQATAVAVAEGATQGTARRPAQ